MPVFPDTPDGQPIEEFQNTIVGGMVNVTEKHLLAPDEVAHLLNVRMDVIGRAEKRRGVNPRGTGIGFPRSLGELRDDNRQINRIYAQFGNGIWQHDGGNNFNPIVTSISLYAEPHLIVQGRGARLGLFFSTCSPHQSNASLPFGHLVHVADDASATVITAVRPRSMAWFQNRLWTLNSCHTAHGPDFLVWSAVNDGRDYAHGNTVQIDRDSGDPGSAIVASRGTNPRLVLFKERSIHELLPVWQTDGFFPATANALDFTQSFLRPIINGTGCIATRAAVSVPQAPGGGDVMYLSQEGIRVLNRASSDEIQSPGRPLSFRIEETIQRINFSPFAVGKAAAIYWDGIAYFAVPVDGATENNLIIAFDVEKGRQESGAFWISDWEASAFVSAKIDSARKFFFLSSQTGISETYNNGTSFTASSHLYETDSGNRDPGRLAVQMDLQTRAYTFTPQDPATGLAFKKRWRWADFAVQADATTVSLQVLYKVDDQEEWAHLTYLLIEPENSYPFLDVDLPFSFEGTKLLRGRVSLHDVIPGYRLQLRLLDENSFARVKIHQFVIRAHPRSTKFRD